jgi:predicted AAA+ superfamily ATPase
MKNGIVSEGNGSITMFYNINLKVVFLGSSRVLLQKGLADSLAGRFETIKMTHWNYSEMRDAFGLSLDEYVYYGGYPGAISLIKEPDRWSDYIRDSIIDATINKDILYDTAIGKPALLRQTFELDNTCGHAQWQLAGRQ